MSFSRWLHAGTVRPPEGEGAAALEGDLDGETRGTVVRRGSPTRLRDTDPC